MNLIFFRFNIASINSPIRTSKERKEAADEVSRYIYVETPDTREMPGCGFTNKLDLPTAIAIYPSLWQDLIQRDLIEGL